MSCGYFWFLGIPMLPLSEAIPLTMICPIVTVFLAWILLGEELRK